MDGTAKGASNTPPEVDALMFELWRRATPSQKLRKVFGLGQMINALARSDIRRRYPGATEREIELRLASRTLDRQTMINAFGWIPTSAGADQRWPGGRPAIGPASAGGRPGGPGCR